MKIEYAVHTQGRDTLKEAWRSPCLLVVLLLAAMVGVFGGAGAPLETLSAGLLAAVAVVGAIVTPQRWASSWSRALAWGCLILLVCLGFGLIPGVWLGMGGHPYQELLSSLGLSSAWPSVAVSAAAALPGVALLAAYAITFGWLVRAAQHEQFAVWLLRAVALVGLGFALYGLWVFVTGNQVVLWLPKLDYLDSLSASFISRNHAATLLGLGILASLGLALLRLGEVSGQLPLPQRLKALWRLVLRPGLGWWLVLVVQWCALILTNSRAGLGVTLLGLLVLIAALAWARAAVRWWLVGGAGLLALLGLLVLAVLGGQVANRATALAYDAAQEGGRAQINTLSWRAAESGPWWGHGYGAWEVAVAVVRTPEIWPTSPQRFVNAHNLYAQTLVELGWPGLLGLLVLGGLGLACLLNGVVTRRRQVVFPAVGLAALVLVAAHSAVDFPLHIPAVMLAWLMLLAAGLGQAFKGVPADTAQPYPWRWRLGGGAVAAGVLALAGWLGWVQLPAWQVAGTVQALQAGQTPTVAQMQQARQALMTCVARAPWQVACGEALTLVHLARAGQVGLETVNGQVLLKAAELQAKQTLRYAPANPVLAYRLARALALQGKAAEARAALTYSVLMGPYEPLLARARAWLLVAALREGGLNPDDTALYQGNLAGLWQQQPHLLWHNLRNQPEAAAVLAAALQAQAVAVDPALWQRLTRTPWVATGALGNLPLAQ